MQRRMWIVLLSGLVTAFCAFGGGDPTTEWTIASGSAAGGTYSYDGTGTGDLYGSGIVVSSVEGTGTSNDGSITILDGLLSFQSGAPTGPWAWGPGNGVAPDSLTVTGCIETAQNSGICIGGETTSTVLLQDEFTSVGVANLTSFGAGELQFGTLSGTLDTTVAAYFGIPSGFVSLNPLSGDDNSVNGLPLVAGSAFGVGGGTPTVSSQGGEFTLAAVPEDWSLSSTLGIFAFGLAVFGVARRFGLIKAVVF